MTRTRIKICGITRVQDADAAVRAGADAVGLVFDPQSPRYVGSDQAAEIANAVAPFVTVVGLFVNAESGYIHQILSRVRVTLLQFHGSETADQCRLYRLPYIKAVHMREGVNLAAQTRAFSDAAGLLLDTYDPAMAGGSGKHFDWVRVPHDIGKPLILAGGLTPDNVAEAVRTARPYAVDVSSGVEKTKGIKDHEKINAFVRAVRGVA